MPIDYTHEHTSRQIMRADAVKTPISPDSGGAISATDGTTTVNPATSIRAAFVEDLGGGVAGVGSVMFSDTNPGAIGARNFWLHTDPNNNAGFLQLYVRNDADTGWRAVGWADNYENSLGDFTGQVYDDGGNVVGVLTLSESSLILQHNGDPVGPNWWQGMVTVNGTGLSLVFTDHNGVSFEIALSTTGLRIVGLPTANPVVANALWNDAGTLKVSAG